MAFDWDAPVYDDIAAEAHADREYDAELDPEFDRLRAEDVLSPAELEEYHAAQAANRRRI